MSPHPEPKPEIQVTQVDPPKLGKMKMYEPSPAYSPMDLNFDMLNVDLDSDSPTSTHPTSRCDSPLLLPSPETSLIDKINSKIESKDKFFSLEFFHPGPSPERSIYFQDLNECLTVIHYSLTSLGTHLATLPVTPKRPQP